MSHATAETVGGGVEEMLTPQNGFYVTHVQLMFSRVGADSQGWASPSYLRVVDIDMKDHSASPLYRLKQGLKTAVAGHSFDRNTPLYPYREMSRGTIVVGRVQALCSR